MPRHRYALQQTPETHAPRFAGADRNCPYPAGQAGRSEWLTPEQRLAAAIIESAISDYIEVSAYHKGLRRTLPSGVRVEGNGITPARALTSAQGLLFNNTTLYDFELACASLGLSATAVRDAVRRAERALGTRIEQRVGSRKRRVARIAPVQAAGERI